MSFDPCLQCPDYTSCGGRSLESRLLPKRSEMKLSEYEKQIGKTEPHQASIVNEVGVFSGDRSSGDACRVLQEYELDGYKYIRLGYYVRNPLENRWRWAQFAQIIDQDEFNELLKRAIKSGILTVNLQ